MSLAGGDGIDALTIENGTVRAVVSPRAAALRLLQVNGLHLVEPTQDSPLEPAMPGAVLAPWPNRVAGARWNRNGRELRLTVTEPEHGHALHGLLARTDFTEVTGDRGDPLRLRARIVDEPGYPFTLAVEVEYALQPDGVAVRIAIVNEGQDPAPVAVGAHPYLRVGDWPSELLSIVVDADHATEPDEAHIPRERFAVAGSPWDLRRPRPLADAPAHATFEWSGARRELTHALEAPDGRRVELRAEPDLRWIQLYVAPALATDDGPRTAVAVEPMSAPPNGLRTGVGMRELAPGESWTTGFRIVLAQRSSLER